jgi:siroheme synthase (precorrin-2 oxidase/ferrochelatase)
VAVRLREKFQREIGPEYADFLELLKGVRPEITSRIRDFGARRELWYRIVDSEALAMLGRGEKDGAARLVREMIDEAAEVQ